MFTEHEVNTFITIDEVRTELVKLKKDFILSEAKFLEIGDHDFLSMVLMTPAVSVAYANGSISLFEEMALNKMARKMSKGGYFMKSDPVSKGMKFLIKSFEKWEDKFLDMIKVCMKNTFDKKSVKSFIGDREPEFEDFSRELMGVPFILVRYISSFFLHGDVEIVETHRINKAEYDRVVELGKKLELSDLNVFKAFLKTYKVK